MVRPAIPALAGFPAWSRYGLAVGLALLALQLRVGMWQIEDGFPFLTFYPAVALACVFLGSGPGTLVALVGGVCSWYLLIPPFWSFELDGDGIQSLACYGALCGVIVMVTSRLRWPDAQDVPSRPAGSPSPSARRVADDARSAAARDDLTGSS